MENTMINKKRIEWVDIAKGIGIFLMVMGHTGIPRIGNQWIYSFHMPLFFFISGFLFQPEKYSPCEFIGRKMKTLVVPYIFFIFLNWIGCEILQYEKYPPHSIIHILLYGSNGAVWFIYVLFFTELYFFMLEKIRSMNNIIISLIIFVSTIIAGYFMFLYKVHLPYKMEVIGMALFFYGIGYWIKSQKIFYKKLNVLLIFVLFMLSVILSYYQTPRLDMADNNYGMGGGTICVALLGIYLTIQVAMLLEHYLSMRLKNAIIYIGKNTIVVVGMSQLVSMSLKKYFELYQVPSFLSSLVRHFLLWCFLVGLIYLFTKYIPFLIGKSSVYYKK